MCYRGSIYLKYEFLFNFIKNIQKKCGQRNLFLTHILSLDIIIGSEFRRKNVSTYIGIRTYICSTYLTTYKPLRYLLDHRLLGK